MRESGESLKRNGMDKIVPLSHAVAELIQEKNGLLGKGPVAVISDLGILKPHPQTKELTVASLHPGVTIEQARSMTGWDLRFSESLQVTPAPGEDELAMLRELERRTAVAHEPDSR